MVLNYIGSKKLLSKQLLEILQELIPDLSSRIVFDGFGGTGSMSLSFQPHCQKVIANDMEYYSHATLHAHLISSWTPRLEQLLQILNELPPSEELGLITQHYSPIGNRMFFTRDNARRIDVIRRQIGEWQASQFINQDEYHYLIACLLEASDKRANVSCVYGAYLKSFKKSSLDPLKLEPVHRHSSLEGEVHRGDVADLMSHTTPGSVLYLDPPYNERQYGANYFVLNVIVKYEEPHPRGITGIPEAGYYKSPYCRKSEIREALRGILSTFQGEYVAMSYNNEGLLSREIIETEFRESGYQVECREIPYKKFKAQKSVEGSQTIEYLFVARKI